MSTRLASTHPTALADPATQIRLLFLRSGADRETVSVDISHWTLADAPSFRAISYTWGSPDIQRTVAVDGQPWTVRQNCAHALWQTRKHFPNSYVWIDSLCIDQRNLREKAVQVDMMGDIYAKASAVLACIGPADESSEYISKALGNLDDLISDVPDDWWDGHNIDHVWFPTTASENTSLELLEHWNRFCDRPYFSRVWVVQEMFGGLDRTMILCGREVLSWDQLVDLHHRMNACFNPYTYESNAGYRSSRTIGNLYRRLIAYDRDYYHFPAILEDSGVCEDPRDRIYGILRLIDWERFGVPRPVPDYSISLHQLALEALKRVRDLDLGSAITIASSLGVTLDESNATEQGRPQQQDNLHNMSRATRL